MARLTELGTGRLDAVRIPIGLIKPGKNFRKDFSTVPDLAVSMFNAGQLVPCKVYLNPDGESVTLVDGERRWRGALYVNEHYDEWMKENPEKHNRFDTLLCIGEARGVTNEERIIAQLDANDMAQPFKATERAAAYKALVEAGWTLQQIAKRVGKSAQHVADYICMLEAPKELKEAVEHGQMSATAATKATKASPEKRQKAIDKVKAGEKVKVSDVAEYVPLGLEKARKLIKKAEGYRDVSKSQTERAKWEGTIHGIEIGVGLRPAEF